MHGSKIESDLLDGERRRVLAADKALRRAQWRMAPMRRHNATPMTCQPPAPAGGLLYGS